MNSLFTESTNILITKAYLPDIDKPAAFPIFDKTCTNTHIRNTDKKMTKSKFEIVSNSLSECNSRINQLFFKSFNTYELRPGKNSYSKLNYLESFIQKEDKFLIEKEKSQIPNELFVSFVDYINQPKLEFKSFEPIFTLTNQAITDLNKIIDFNTAFKFLDAYGYSYPFTSYETSQYSITIIRLTSFHISDPFILENLVRSFYSQYKRKSDKKIVYRHDADYGTLRFEVIVIESPQIFKCNDQVRWIPLPKLINTCSNSHLIEDKSVINYLYDCWLVRDTSYLLVNKIFSDQILVNLIGQNKNFNFENYWYGSFMKKVYSNYEKFLFKYFYSKKNFPNDYSDDIVLNFLSNLAKRADYETKILELILTEEFLILTDHVKVPPNYMLLYYTHDWIENDPLTFLSLLTSIKATISMLYNEPVCILVDYEHFGFVKHLTDFYFEYKFVEYSNVKVNRAKDTIVIDAKNQMRFDFDNVMHLISSRKNVLKLKNNLAMLINNFSFPKICRKKIVEIDLSKNGLLSIEMDSFDDMVNLEKLNLSQNSLSHVKSIFKKLRNLRYLNLSMNKINFIDPCVFNDLENLVCLNLSNNYLKNVPHIWSLIKLRELNLGSNMLKKIDREFENLKNLRTLFLCFNSIEFINFYNFKNQKNMEFFFLNSNNLKNIDSKIFLHMKKLKILLLCGNENIPNEDIENLKFSSQEFERNLYVYKNEQYKNVIKYFDKIYKYFGFDIQALRITQEDNSSDSVSTSDAFEFSDYTSRL